MTSRPNDRSRPGRSPALAAALLTVVAMLGACGGGSGSDAASDGPGDAAGADTAATPDAPPTPDSGTDSTTTTPADGPPSDTAAGSDAAGHGSAWATRTRTHSGTRPGAEVVDARAAGHDGYDRIVFEFSEKVPGYTIGYAGSELRQCGSGRPVELSTEHALIVELQPAAAHDEQGNGMDPRTLAPRLPVLRGARIICDFEGVVEWVVEAERRAPFRVLTLEDPARLVLDLSTADG